MTIDQLRSPSPATAPDRRASGPAGASRRPGRPRASARRRRESVAGYVFLTPWLIGFFGLTLGPMLISLYLAFTRYDLFTAPRFVGLDNFVTLFNDPDYLHSAGITLVYVAVGTPVKLAAALAVALLLHRLSFGSGFFRSAIYAPSLIGASVSVAIVWRALFNTGGPVDRGLQVFGIDLGGWVGNPSLVMPMMVLLAVWQFGAPMVIFLAGLKQVPAELYEAAEVDGAGAIRRFASVTVPMLSPVVFFNLLLEMIGAFQVFASAFIISSGSGGPAGATNFYTVYLYQRAFGSLQMGYASAMAWVLLIVVGVVAFVLFRTSKAWVHYGGESR